MSASGSVGGFILAGGKSSRMGTDKALLRYRGSSLLDHMTALLGEVGATPVLPGGGMRGLSDVVPAGGPVASLAALQEFCLTNSAPATWIVVPVDMPLLSPELLRRLLGAPGTAAYFVGQTLPLKIRLDQRTAKWFRDTTPRLASPQGVSIWQFLTELGAQPLPPTGEEVRQLANINSPEEWTRLLSTGA